jgi:hypothetical protein
MSDDFFRTIMGRKFYESDIPRLVAALERIAESLPKPTKPLDTAPKPINTQALVEREQLMALLRMINTRIHQEEIADHFPYSVISSLDAVVKGEPPHIPAHFRGREQPLREDVLGEHQRGIPGILFPVDNGGDCDSEDGKVFIAREDASMMFRSDVDAANFITCLTGIVWKKYFDVPGQDYYHPYFEITLDEAERIHQIYGSTPFVRGLTRQAE